MLHYSCGPEEGILGAVCTVQAFHPLSSTLASEELFEPNATTIGSSNTSVWGLLQFRVFCFIPS